MNLPCLTRRLAAWPLGRLAACLAALAFSSASFALAPYDSTGATIELVPVAGGAAVASTHVTFPPDAATVNLAIPPSVIAAMAPGSSVSFFARVTSDALTAGSTCTANALSRQITFTKAGSTTAAAVPTLGSLGLVLLAGLMGVAAYRNRRVRGALNVLLPVIAIAALSLGSATSLNAQATDPNTTYAGSVNDAIQSVRAVVDAAGNVSVTGTRGVSCQAPDAPGTASIGGPTSSVPGDITLTLAAADADGIASWEIEATRINSSGTVLGVQIVASGSTPVPASVVVAIAGGAGNHFNYVFRITDSRGNVTTSLPWRVDRV